MGMRLQKRIKLTKGINLNFSKSGMGISFGGKSGRIGIGPRGIRTSTRIPGTGIRYEKQHSMKGKKRRSMRPKKGRKAVGKMGVMVHGKVIHEEPVYMSTAKKRRGCLGCCTLPLVGSILVMLVLLSILLPLHAIAEINLDGLTAENLVQLEHEVRARIDEQAQETDGSFAAPIVARLIEDTPACDVRLLESETKDGSRTEVWQIGVDTTLTISREDDDGYGIARLIEMSMVTVTTRKANDEGKTYDSRLWQDVMAAITDSPALPTAPQKSEIERMIDAAWGTDLTAPKGDAEHVTAQLRENLTRLSKSRWMATYADDEYNASFMLEEEYDTDSIRQVYTIYFNLI